MFKAIQVNNTTNNRVLIFLGNVGGALNNRANVALAELALRGAVPFSSVSSYEIPLNNLRLADASTGKLPRIPGNEASGVPDAEGSIRVCSARIDVPYGASVGHAPARRARRYIPNLPRVERLALPEI